MRIRFYLKRPEADNLTAIYALVHYGGQPVKFYINESIHPKNWNPTTQTARNTPRFPEHPEFNERLLQIKSLINKIYLNHRNQFGGQSPTPEKLTDLYNAATGKGANPVNFLDYFQDYINRTKNGQRINPKSKKPIKASGVRGYESTLSRLHEFKPIWKRPLDFQNIDLDFHQQFTDFLTREPIALAANTVGSHIKRIKAVMSEATERGANTNTAFKSRLFTKQSEDADTIYVNENELRELRSLDLSHSRRLDNVRDSFLIGCYTGLRFSDFSLLTPKNISNGFIKVTQQKTGNPVTVPVHRVVAEVLEKNGGSIPTPISNEKFNQYLKEIGKMLECFRSIETKTITKGGVRETNNYQKWELLTTHTARRSFATNEFLAGTPTLTIMAITGHKTEKSFLKYIRVNPDEHAQNIAKLWKSRELKNLKAV